MINKQRLLDTFLDYVQIDSETGFEAAMAERLTVDLQALGFTAFQDNSAPKTGSTGNNVYCLVEGDSSAEPILLSAHIDTVVPGKGIEPVIEDGVIRSKGNTILGGDDKSGVVSILEVLRVIKEQGIKHRPIECLFTVCEESGLKGAKHADYSKLRAKKALALDSSGDVGKIIVNAPGQLKIEAEVIGKPAHAGIAPEKGISAIMVAAEAVSKMKLLRIDEETTANIGTFKAESPTNIVCEKVTIIAETRSRNNDKLKAQGDHMVKCLQDACDKHGATLNCQIDTSYISYNVAKDDDLVKMVSDKCEEMGLPVDITSTGGGSDANVFNLNGIKAVVLGTGMDKVHTTDEQITVKNIENLAELLLRIVQL